jgi:hypothetical protein
MERFGLNAFSRPLYRVVWSDSRTYLLGGDWGGGSFEMRETQLYDDIHAWVLEKWQSAEDFAGPREAWDSKERDLNTPSLGPYPAEGEYVFAYAFPSEPTHSMISLVVRAINGSRNLSALERKRSIMAPLEARRKRNHQKIDDVFDDSQPAFRYADAMVSAVSNGATIHRKPSKRIKDMTFKRSAEELGMPMSDNAFFTGEQHGNRHTG